MAKVRVIKNVAVWVDNIQYCPKNPVFEIEDNEANRLCGLGVVEIIEQEDSEQEKQSEQEPVSFVGLDFLEDGLRELLAENSITTCEVILESGLDGLVSIKGIGKKTATMLLTEASSRIGG